MTRQTLIIKLATVFFCTGVMIFVSNSNYNDALANPFFSNLPFIGKITEVTTIPYKLTILQTLDWHFLIPVWKILRS